MTDFATESRDGFFIVRFPFTMGIKSGCEAHIEGWLDATEAVHVIDFSGVQVFDPSHYRSLTRYKQGLKTDGKSLYLARINEKILNQFKRDGLEGAFDIIDSLEEIRRGMGKPKSVADVNFINPFIEATQYVLSIQAKTEVTPGKAFLRKPSDRMPVEIAGMLSLVSKTFRGTISISFRKEIFLRIYENMLGERHAEINFEVEDAAGEILNIIFGRAKAFLNDQKGYSLEKAIPTVLVGERLALRHQGQRSAIVVPFNSAVGTFHVEIMLDID